MTSGADVLSLIKEKELKYVDLRFTDTRGKEQHVTVPASQVDAKFFTDGKMFDGSSIAGWKGINESDMILMPDASTAIADPFFEDPTLILRCDVLEPSTMQGYERDPRSIAKRAQAYLKSTGIADGALFGPEKALGTPTPIIRMATWVTVLASRAVTSQFLLLMLIKTSVVRCVTCSKKWAWL
jgi:glutamine synthetase